MADETSLEKSGPLGGWKAPSKGIDEEVIYYGRELVVNLHVLMKMAQIHDPSNVALTNPAEGFMLTVKRLWNWNEKVELRIVGDHLFMGDARLRMDVERFVSYTSVTEEFKRVGVGKVKFHRGMNPDELRRFAYLLVQTDSKQPDPYETLAGQIRKSSIVRIEIEPYEERHHEFDAAQRDQKETAKNSYYKALTVVTEVMDNIKLGQSVSIKRAKRVVQTMVDLLLEDETNLLGLTTLRSHDLYTHNHSVNVCILSLVMGQRLGYSKKQLTVLGMAGLFHDMGKANIPSDVLNKATDFTEEDWKLMRHHPIEGVKYLLRLKGISEITIRMVTGVFEHHLNSDLSGYPKLESKWEVSLLGRLIGIVDCYDALTSSRVYNRTPYSPDKALKFMLSRSGKAFDSILMKIFVNCVGIIPIGTLLLLNTRELAVVLESQPNPEKATHPRVRIITDSHGNEVSGEVMDLSDSQATSGRYIARTVDPTKYKVDPARYFI